jgi:hypothetical protein
MKIISLTSEINLSLIDKIKKKSGIWNLWYLLKNYHLLFVVRALALMSVTIVS